MSGQVTIDSVVPVTAGDDGDSPLVHASKPREGWGEVPDPTPTTMGQGKKASFTLALDPPRGNLHNAKIVSSRAAPAQQEVKKSKWVVNPETSRFMQKWDGVTIAALLFVAVVTPYEVCFLETKWDWMLAINLVINVIFITDMTMQFFLMYPVKTPYGRRMVCSHKSIVKNYLMTWFPIDVISVLPFDFLGLMFEGVAIFEMLKKVKIIRLIRLLKLMRVLKASRVFKRWETRMSINYSKLALFKFLLLMVTAGHWMACLWGMTGKLAYDADTDPDAEPESADAKRERQQHSWMFKTFQIDSDNPDPEPTHIYVASLYWSVMTLTSIGYGDIIPASLGERVMCVFLMLVGALIWAFIIGQACSVLANLDLHDARFKQTLDDLNYMLADRGIKNELRHRLRAFFFETKEIERLKTYKTLISYLSPALQGEVARELNEVWVKKVWYLDKPDISEKMIVACAQRIDMTIFAQGETFGERRTLYILNRGLVGRRGRLLRVSAVWGEDFLLECSELRDASLAVSLTYADMLFMHYRAMEQILNAFPKEKKAIRKYIVRMACWRGFLREANKRRGIDDDAAYLLLDKSNANGGATALECGATQEARLALLLERAEMGVTNLTARLDEQQLVLAKQADMMEALLKDANVPMNTSGKESTREGKTRKSQILRDWGPSTPITSGKDGATRKPQVTITSPW